MVELAAQVTDSVPLVVKDLAVGEQVLLLGVQE